jgi:hypothetical protein
MSETEISDHLRVEILRALRPGLSFDQAYAEHMEAVGQVREIIKQETLPEKG